MTCALSGLGLPTELGCDGSQASICIQLGEGGGLKYLGGQITLRLVGLAGVAKRFVLHTWHIDNTIAATEYTSEETVSSHEGLNFCIYKIRHAALIILVSGRASNLATVARNET